MTSRSDAALQRQARWWDAPHYPDQVNGMAGFPGPASRFAGAVLAVLAVWIGLVLARRRSRRKALEYDVTAIPLLAGHAVQGRQIELRVDGVEVRNPQLICLRFRNAGRQRIAADDFDSPIGIVFSGPDARVVSAELPGSSPGTAEARLDDGFASRTGNAHEIHLRPMRLDPGDWIDVRVLVSASDATLFVEGGRVGVSPTGRAGHGARADATLVWLLVSAYGVASSMLRPSATWIVESVAAVLIAAAVVTRLLLRLAPKPGHARGAS